MHSSNSPTRFPTFRWLFSWRFLRALLFVLVSLATLLALFYAEENLRGKRAWDAYVRELTAKGEKLSLTEFIPPPVPDDQNLTLCPLLKPILDIEFQPAAHGRATKVWRDTNGLNRMQHWSRTWSVVQYHATHDTTHAKRAGQDLGRKSRELQNRLEKTPLTNGWIDLVGWQAYYRTGTNLDGFATTNSPAADVLSALRFIDEDIAELQQEAIRRRLARWPIYYDTNSPGGILLPHLARCKGMVSLLQLHSAARLAARDTDGGFAEIELAMRLAETVREEPFLISQLVRNACYHLLLQTVKEGLARHQFTEGQLERLQKDFGTVDLLAAFQVSMRAERAWHCDWNRYVKETSRVDWASLFGNNELGATFNILATFMRFAPSGWVYQNQLNYCHLFDRISLRTVDVPARRVYPEVAAAVNAEPGLRVGFHPFNLLGRLLFPATGSAARKFAHTQTQLNEAVVACALERHRLIHGSYPETVQALVPRFLEKIPQDLFSGQPLQYRHTAQGQYLLSSADWSEKAEVGGQRTPWVDSLVIGDWDWELPQKL